MRKYPVLGSVILLFLLTPALGRDSDIFTRGSGPIHDPQERGAEIVDNPKMPKHPSMRMVFEEDLTIGVKEGDENYMFGRLVYFNTDDEGNFYVTDWDRKRIQKYDPEGRYIRTIGRSGQGPGEFQNVWRPEFDADGHLYLLDIAAHRISFFDRESGRLLRQLQIPSDFHPTLINKSGFFVGDKALVEEGPKGTKFTTVYGLFDGQTRILKEFLKTIWEPKEGSGRGEAAIVSSLANNLSDQAFKPNPHYLLARNGDIWMGYPATYEVVIYDPDGKPRRVIRKDHDPRPVTAKDKERFLEEQESDFFRFLPAPAQALKNKVVEAVRFPENKPAYHTFALMENGWLAVVVESLHKSGALFDIFDERGRYAARFEADIPVEGLFFKNGKAYALETSEEGYRFVKRYRYEIQQDKSPSGSLGRKANLRLGERGRDVNYPGSCGGPPASGRWRGRAPRSPGSA